MTQDGEDRLVSATVALNNRIEELAGRIETLDVVVRGRMAELADQRKKDRITQRKWRKSLLAAIARRLTSQGETIQSLETKIKRFRSRFLQNKQTAIIAAGVGAVLLTIIILMVRPEILPEAIKALRGTGR